MLDRLQRHQGLIGIFLACIILHWSSPELFAELTCKIVAVNTENQTVDLQVSASDGERFQIVASQSMKAWTAPGNELIGTGIPSVERVNYSATRGFFMAVSLDATNGWFANATDDPDFALVLANADGNSIAVATECDAAGNLTRVKGFAWRNPSGGTLYYELDARGYPSSASSGGDLILVERLSDDLTEIRASALNQDGTGELIVANIDPPPNGISMTLGGPLNDPATLTEVLDILGFTMSTIGCVVGVAASPTGIAIPLAALACTGAVASGISLVSGDDVSKSFGFFADVVGCIPDDLGAPFACASAIATIAGFYASAHEETKNTPLNLSRTAQIAQIIECLDKEGGWISWGIWDNPAWIPVAIPPYPGPEGDSFLWSFEVRLTWAYQIDPILQYPSNHISCRLVWAGDYEWYNYGSGQPQPAPRIASSNYSNIDYSTFPAGWSIDP